MDPIVLIQENNLSQNKVIAKMFSVENSGATYTILTGVDFADTVYEGFFYCGTDMANIDLSPLVIGLKDAGFKSYKIETLFSNRAVGPEAYFNVYAGGISKALQRKLLALNTNIFDWKLKNSASNFFLTTRTNGIVIFIPENELLPLQYYAKGHKFHIKVDGETVLTLDHSADLTESVKSIDLAEIRSQLITSHNKLVSVFDIVTDTSYSCSIIITEAEKRSEYFLKFRNSFGSYEMIAIHGEIAFAPTFSDVSKLTVWDSSISDFVDKNATKTITNSFTATTGYKTESERLFLIDLLLSDSVYLIASGVEFAINVGAELPTMASTNGIPVDITLKIDFVDKENNFSDIQLNSIYKSLTITTLENITSGNADILV